MYAFYWLVRMSLALNNNQSISKMKHCRDLFKQADKQALDLNVASVDGSGWDWMFNSWNYIDRNARIRMRSYPRLKTRERIEEYYLRIGILQYLLIR